MNNGKRNWKLQIAVIAALTLVASLAAPAVNAADNRMRVEMNETFEINGTVHLPNVVTVREVGSYSPNSVFAEVCVGSDCIGRLIAHDGERQELSDVDSLVFERNPQGQLVLVGLSFRGQPTRMLASSDERVHALASPGSAGSQPTLLTSRRVP